MREHVGITDFLRHTQTARGHRFAPPGQIKAQKPLFPIGHCHQPQLTNAMLIHGDEIQVVVDRIKPELRPLGCVGLQQCLQCDTFRLTS